MSNTTQNNVTLTEAINLINNYVGKDPIKIGPIPSALRDRLIEKYCGKYSLGYDNSKKILVLNKLEK